MNGLYLSVRGERGEREGRDVEEQSELDLPGPAPPAAGQEETNLVGLLPPPPPLPPRRHLSPW